MTLRQRLYSIIFEAETRAGKFFDISLILIIVSSVLLTMLETVESFEKSYRSLFFISELLFTSFFTIEYILRLYCSPKPRAYVFSFYGIVDLVSTLPFYLSLFLPGAQSLTVVRGLRMLRIFRVLKLQQYAVAGQQLSSAIKQSWPKIFVFLTTIVTAVSIMGALMFLIEGRENGFTSIPKGVYWAVVTMTTVGYGDLVPKTDFGQFISIVLMILGYGVIAVPTGIVSSEFIKQGSDVQLTRTCSACFTEGHRLHASFCDSCGEQLT